MENLVGDKKEFEVLVDLISKAKIAYDSKLNVIKGLDAETVNIKEEISGKQDYEAKLKKDLSTIKAKHLSNNKSLVVQNDEIKYEFMKLDKDIEDLILAIKEGRKKEIMLLEKVELEEKNIRQIKDKGAALYLSLHGRQPGNSDLGMQLNKEIGGAYDEKLSKILKKNVSLKKDKVRLQDMIDLMQGMAVDVQREKQIARDMVDSGIDSMSMFSGQMNF